MSRLTPSLFISRIEGAVGASEFQRSRLGASMYLRKKHTAWQLSQPWLEEKPAKCACEAFTLADLIYQTMTPEERAEWRAALKKPGMSAYDLWMKEALSLATQGLNLPDHPGPGGGYSAANAIPGSIPAPLICQMWPPVVWRCVDGVCTQEDFSAAFRSRQECLDSGCELPPPGPPVPDFVQYYPFEPGPIDIPPSLKDLTLNGGAFITDEHVRGMGGLDLPGGDGCFARAGAPNPPIDAITNEFTLLCWFFLRDNDLASLITKCDPTYPHPFSNFIASGSTLYFQVGSGMYDYQTLTAQVGTDHWTHVAMRCDPDQIDIWINGQHTSTAPLTCTPAAGQDHLVLGNRNDGATHGNLLMDEVLIYDRALSEEEILAIYDY